MTNEKINNVRTAFNSILRSDYISIDDAEQMKNLDEYYVDLYNNLSLVIEDQDNYISGRRGTGKTTLLMRGYYECLKTVDSKIKRKSNLFTSKKVLPLFIDLSNCKEMFSQPDDLMLNHNFLSLLVTKLKLQLKSIDNGLIKNRYSELPEFLELENMLKAGVQKRVSKSNIEHRGKLVSEDSLSIGLALDNSHLDFSVKESEKIENSMSINEIRGISVDEFFIKVNTIRTKCQIDSIFIFIDEFSDLEESEQLKFSTLLKKLLGSKINVFFKIGTITDRYDFGEKIIIARDIFPIHLDLNEFVERYGGIINTLRHLESITHELIKKRINTYAQDVNLTDIFKTSINDLLVRLTREAMGVPRTLGLILQNALSQSIHNPHDKRIGINEVNYGIRTTRKMYFQQFEGAVKKKLISAFYTDMWNSLLDKALAEKAKKPDRPASHFLIDPIRKKYMNVFCENFMIHFLEDARASKYSGKYGLYSFDYDICVENNIIYASDKDEFTSARFIYDLVISAYDGYFMKDNVKSYSCSKCGRIFLEDDVGHSKVKRCFEDDTVLDEIVHKSMPRTEGNYTEVEVKILGFIASLNEKTAMSAVDIAEVVGCSMQKVAGWASRVLEPTGLIRIKYHNSKNYYYDVD